MATITALIQDAGVIIAFVMGIGRGVGRMDWFATAIMMRRAGGISIRAVATVIVPVVQICNGVGAGVMNSAIVKAMLPLAVAMILVANVIATQGVPVMGTCVIVIQIMCAAQITPVIVITMAGAFLMFNALAIKITDATLTKLAPVIQIGQNAVFAIGTLALMGIATLTNTLAIVTQTTAAVGRITTRATAIMTAKFTIHAGVMGMSAIATQSVSSVEKSTLKCAFTSVIVPHLFSVTRSRIGQPVQERFMTNLSMQGRAIPIHC
jgi:hypothetical protein